MCIQITKCTDGRFTEWKLFLKVINKSGEMIFCQQIMQRKSENSSLGLIETVHWQYLYLQHCEKLKFEIEQIAVSDTSERILIAFVCKIIFDVNVVLKPF